MIWVVFFGVNILQKINTAHSVVGCSSASWGSINFCAPLKCLCMNRILVSEKQKICVVVVI